jgi:membrane protease YdiL (CAAX protease family)
MMALLSAGVGVIGGTLMSRLDTQYAPILSLATLWLGLMVGVLYAFLRSRPAALLTLKPQDFLWGAVLGLALRLIQGVTSDAGSSPFPSPGSGTDPHAQALLAGVLGPVVEEVFFRGVVVVVVYQLLRRSIGVASAATSAALFSTGAFVLIHAVFQPLTLVDGFGLFLVSMTCSGVVLLTGRLWGAVLAHMIYNATFLALVLLGGALA